MVTVGLVMQQDATVHNQGKRWPLTVTKF